jgi:hypothetical protein
MGASPPCVRRDSTVGRLRSSSRVMSATLRTSTSPVNAASPPRTGVSRLRGGDAPVAPCSTESAGLSKTFVICGVEARPPARCRTYACACAARSAGGAALAEFCSIPPSCQALANCQGGSSVGAEKYGIGFSASV